jgi:hypothetical protein
MAGRQSRPGNNGGKSIDQVMLGLFGDLGWQRLLRGLTYVSAQGQHLRADGIFLSNGPAIG